MGMLQAAIYKLLRGKKKPPFPMNSSHAGGAMLKHRKEQLYYLSYGVHMYSPQQDANSRPLKSASACMIYY